MPVLVTVAAICTTWFFGYFIGMDDGGQDERRRASMVPEVIPEVVEAPIALPTPMSTCGTQTLHPVFVDVGERWDIPDEAVGM
jgi:hypothetical protein